MNGVGSKYFPVVNCTVQLVPNESAAWSSRMTERPIVSQPLSEPVEMSGSPAGMPVRALTSSVIRADDRAGRHEVAQLFRSARRRSSA